MSSAAALLASVAAASSRIETGSWAVAAALACLARCELPKPRDLVLQTPDHGVVLATGERREVLKRHT